MNTEWKKIFTAYGVKVVTKTDKKKTAYVPNAEQREVLRLAGITPSHDRPATEFRIKILNDLSTKSVGASFYHSARAQERAVEPRIGHGFISSWLQEGDQVVIGVLGGELFALKAPTSVTTSPEELLEEACKRARTKTVLKLAHDATGKPLKKPSTGTTFVRNPFVVAGALIRASGKCDMPTCKVELFHRDDGTNYLEVHHIVPLAEGGDDTMANAAALCPRCHRELHHGKRRSELRKALSNRS
jgi:hypothetical protein